MKKLMFALSALATACLWLGLSTGCTTVHQIDPATGLTNTVHKIDPVKVYALAKGAAAIGTTEALRVVPSWRQNFVDAKSELDRTIADGTITGTRLRIILDKLPIKELKSDTSRIAILSATLLFDVATGATINVEQNEYVLAASKGVSEGIGQGLGQ